jgi:aquaporin Z
MKKLVAELFGTYWLVFGGCGSALIACSNNTDGANGIGYVGVSLAFGLTVLTMAYAVGHISGGHFNPAVTFGLWASGRFDKKDIPSYIISQCVGGILAAATLYLICNGKDGFSIDNEVAGAFASNGYGAFSPDGYNMLACFVAELVLTFFFLIVILGATDKFANGKFAGIAIGLALTLIHLISIPITNTSVNPVRSLSQAVFVQGESMVQLWLFWVAPILGAILAGYTYKNFLQNHAAA